MIEQQLKIVKKIAKAGDKLIVEGGTDTHAVLILKTKDQLPKVDITVNKEGVKTLIQTIAQERILGLIGFSEISLRTATVTARNSFEYLMIPTSYYELIKPYFVHDLIDIIKNDRNGLDFSKTINLKTNRSEIIDNIKLVFSFQESVEKKDYEVHYQPLLNLKTNKIEAFEALTRWNAAPEGIYPDQYFAQIEKTPISTYFFEYILDNVLDDIIRYDIPCVSLNVAGYDIKNPSFAQKVIDKLEKKQVDVSKIKIELTERAELSDKTVKQNVKELKTFGIKICLDDFGEGVSSIKLVPELKPDVIKIDKVWLSYSELDLETLIVYALTNRCEVIVEGIETQHQLDFVRKKGATFAQGYFLGKPSPIEEQLDFISEAM